MYVLVVPSERTTESVYASPALAAAQPLLVKVTGVVAPADNVVDVALIAHEVPP